MTPNYKMVLMQLIAVEQTPQHKNPMPALMLDRIEAWMGRWTVANNYPAVPIPTSDEAMLILRQWKKKFIQSFRSALPDTEDLVTDAALLKAFSFNYRAIPLELYCGTHLDSDLKTIQLADIEDSYE